MSSIEIPFSKKKLVLIFIFSVLLVASSFWLQVIAGKRTENARGLIGNPMALKVVGAAGILFFGLALYFSLRKLLDTAPGLVIADDGITDRSTGISAGFIAWQDVVDVKEVKVFGQKFLLLMLRNPKSYIDEQKDFLKKKTMNLNYKNYGSPISISANALQIDYDELKNILIRKLAESKR